MEELAQALAGLTICPVRHHSPYAALAVERTLRAARPRLVLIEGPSDASDLIPLLLAPDTRPPVAILAYRPAAAEEQPRTVVVPFCEYSPELVAMRVGRELGAEVRFCDAPAALWLAEEPEGDERRGAENLADAPPARAFDELAARFGFASHDEFWDARCEMGAAEGASEVLGAYGDMVRAWFATAAEVQGHDRARESWMLRELARALQSGLRADEIALVCGAAHRAGLRAGEVDAAAVERLERLPPARFAVIPYSYPRLSEQLGYGAGNRAPAFYRELWRRGLDWDGAALDLLLRLLEGMRARGYVLGLADAIEAQRLARNLAGLREKPAPGLEEVRDAALACYGRGGVDPTPFLNALAVGEEIGAVSAQAAKTALQQEFLDAIKRYGIPFADSPRDLRLNLTGAREREVSAFLHRLTIASVPFARLLRAGSVAAAGHKAETTDPLERLMTLRERWEVRWTPAVDIRLIELAAHGNTLAEVCARLLRKRLAEQTNLAEAVEVLLDVTVGGLSALQAETLAACEAISAGDDDFKSLGRASYLLDGLVTYGGERANVGVLAALRERAFARAALLLPEAAAADDEEARGLAEALKALHQVAVRRRERGEDASLLYERLRRTARAEAGANGLLAGLACAILYLQSELTDEDLTDALRLRLSPGEEPLRGAAFVEGVFSLNRSVLVRSGAVVGTLTAFLVGLSRDAFLAALPILRRTFAGLSPSEMGYLVTTIAEGLGLGAPPEGGPAPSMAQLGELADLDQAIGDLFG